MENMPSFKKRKLSLSLLNRCRFSESSSEVISSLQKVTVTKNTKISSRWAVKYLNDWFKNYQERNPNCPCPQNIVTPSPKKEDLKRFLTIYIAGTRNQKEERYPLKTIHVLLSGFLRSMRLENPSYPNIFDKSDPSFATFQTALDNLFKKQFGHFSWINIHLCNVVG